MTDDKHHIAKCVLQVGHLVRELTATIDPRDQDLWFMLLRGDLGDVQDYFEAQSAADVSA